MPKLLNAALDELLTRCDVLLCPAAPGPAPKGLDTTGDPIFNGIWTFCGTPCVSVPLLTLLALLAFISIAVFLLILAFKVPSPDLVIMILITLGFVAYDLATSSGKKGD